MAEIIDNEHLIEEVKKYREIWDIKCPIYHDKHAKRNAWLKILAVLEPQFEEKEQKEKEEISSKIVNRWRNIKDNYKRSMRKVVKSGQGAGNGRQYVYARQLSFLDESSELAPTDSSIQNEVAEGQKEVTEENEATATKNNSRTEKRTIAARRKKLEDSLIQFMNAPIPSQPSNPSSPYMAFFESLQPALQTFPVDDYIEFQSEVLNLVQRFRQRHRSSSNPYPSSYNHPPQHSLAPNHNHSSNYQRNVNFTPTPNYQHFHANERSTPPSQLFIFCSPFHTSSKLFSSSNFYNYWANIHYPSITNRSDNHATVATHQCNISNFQCNRRVKS